uniref:tetratricopeptide repeat protein n=1 Tax=Acuticoccus sediminis TaxID=2184697 RepID=UPI00384C1619
KEVVVFNQRLYHEVAHAMLADLFDGQVVSHLLATAIRERIERAELWNRLSRDERVFTLTLADRMREAVAADPLRLAACIGEEVQRLADEGALRRSAEIARMILNADPLAERPGDWTHMVAISHRHSGEALRAMSEFQAASIVLDRAIAVDEHIREIGAGWEPGADYDLALAHLNRARVRQGLADLSGARADYDAAIEGLTELKRQPGAAWPPAYEDGLAWMHIRRGDLLASCGNLSDALPDYAQAVALQEVLTRNPGAQDSPLLTYGLASSYFARGSALHSIGEIPAAIDDFDRAITILETITAERGHLSDLQIGDALAAAYSYRGVARASLKEMAYARADGDQSIALLTALKARSGGEWPPYLEIKLASQHLNRSLDHSENDDVVSATADNEIALSLFERLVLRFGSDIPLALERELIRAKSIRAGLYHSRGDHEGAVDSYNEVITALLAARRRDGLGWPPYDEEGLSINYGARGAILSLLEKWEDAGSDLAQAVELRQGLKLRLGEEWTPDMEDGLATACFDLGGLHYECDHFAAATDMFDTAISLWTELARRSRDGLLPQSANGLAKAHLMRGQMRSNLGDIAGKIVDRCMAADLWGMLKHRLGAEWPDDWEQSLVTVEALLRFDREDHPEQFTAIEAAAAERGRYNGPSSATGR